MVLPLLPVVFVGLAAVAVADDDDSCCDAAAIVDDGDDDAAAALLATTTVAPPSRRLVTCCTGDNGELDTASAGADGLDGDLAASAIGGRRMRRGHILSIRRTSCVPSRLQL